MFNRRELLKYFTIGTAIVPLVDGLPKFQAEAKLIEEPKVDLVVAKELPRKDGLINAFHGREKLIAQITFVSEDRRIVYETPGYLTSLSVEAASELVDVTSWNSPYQQFTASSPSARIKLEFLSVGPIAML
jgi:hypothetical protein